MRIFQFVTSVFIVSLGFSGQIAASSLGGACKVSMDKKLPTCKKSTVLSDFEVDKKKFTTVYFECDAEGEEYQSYALIERLAGEDCKLMDSDTSLVGYMYGVSKKYKSDAPIKAFENAIKAELAHRLKTDSDKKLYIEKLKQKASVKDITVDQQWVLKYLSQGSGR